MKGAAAFLCAWLVASVVRGDVYSYTRVETLGGNVYQDNMDAEIGRGTGPISEHTNDTFATIPLANTLLSGIVVSGTVDNLQLEFTPTFPPYDAVYANQGVYAQLQGSVGVIAPTSLTDPAALFAAPIYGAASFVVDNGLPNDLEPGGTTIGDTFSVSLGADAVAYVNSLVLSGATSFELVFSASPVRTLDSDNGFGDLTFSVTPVPEPSSLALCGVALVAGLGYATRRRAKRA